MFAKLAKKYSVPNPLDQESKPTTSATPSFGTATSAPSAFSLNTSASPPPSGFGNGSGTSASTFGAATNLSTDAAKSPFGSKPAAPFGGTSNVGPFSSPTPQTSASPFGTQATSSTPFGQNTTPSAPAFGLTSAPSSTPATLAFGQTSTPASTFGTNTSASISSSSARTFGGRTAREIVQAFYQKYNPSKIPEIDKVLMKYAGKEEQLLRNLAKKYNLDPNILGLSAAPAPAPVGFGSPAPLGQSTQFGHASTMGSSGGFSSFASATPTANTGFGSFAPSSQSTTPGFGALSPAPAPSTGFGGSAGFGSPPFGAARR